MSRNGSGNTEITPFGSRLRALLHSHLPCVNNPHFLTYKSLNSPFPFVSQGRFVTDTTRATRKTPNSNALPLKTRNQRQDLQGTQERPLRERFPAHEKLRVLLLDDNCEIRK